MSDVNSLIDSLYSAASLAEDKAKSKSEKKKDAKQEKTVYKPIVISSNALDCRYEPVVFPFYIPQIDVLLSKQKADNGILMGLSGGQFMYITGNADTGKSRLLHRHAISTLNRGGVVILFDIDKQFNIDRIVNGLEGKLSNTGKRALKNRQYMLKTGISSFYDLYFQLREIGVTLTLAATEYAKKNKIPLSDIVYSRDVIPTVIHVDGISAIMSTDRTHKEIHQSEKTAAVNSDIHIMFKDIAATFKMLGVPIIMTGHMRAKFAGSNSWSGQAYWATLQEYVTISLVLSNGEKVIKTRKGEKYEYATETKVSIKKMKGIANKDHTIPSIRFVNGRGFDMIHACFAVLNQAGFSPNIYASEEAAIEIYAENINGDKIPKALAEYVTPPIKKGEWIKRLSDYGGAQAFTLTVISNLYKLPPMSINDQRLEGDMNIGVI